MNCIACGHAVAIPQFTATDRLYGTTQQRFQVVACANCGLLRLAPLPDPGELTAYYPNNYWFASDGSAAGRLEETWRRLVLRDHVRFVSRAVRDAGVRGPLLDVGCGGGLFLGMMRGRGVPGMGLDSSREAALVAWREQGVPVVCGNLEQCPIAEGTFAAVSMFHVLEHLRDPRAYLEAARRLLRPGGRLIVQVPNAACWQFRLLGRRWNGLDVPRHLVNFRARDLAALLEATGFHVIRRKYFSLRDNPAGLASSLAPALDPMARRVRRVRESAGAKLAKDILYLTLVAVVLPFTVLEAACAAGSTVMFEAGRQP
jgi:SAM-dependent methyltransferase